MSRDPPSASDPSFQEVYMDEVNRVEPDAESSQAATSLTPTRRRFAMPPAGRRKRRALLAEPAPGSRRGAPRSPRRPASSLAERWTRVDGVNVFYRESPQP